MAHRGRFPQEAEVIGPKKYNHTMSSFHIPTMAEMTAAGKAPEVLFWVGCAGSFDDRAKRITKAIARILNAAETSFAVLGQEESCTGDPAKRAGNEFLYQMQAAQNIATLNGYGIKRIITGCPHCFNMLKNEYPELGGQYDVLHHTQFIRELIETGKLRMSGDQPFKGRRITFHDPLLPRTSPMENTSRLERSSRNSTPNSWRCDVANKMPCAAAQAERQMFKEAEPGEREVNHARTDEALETQPEVIATGCPFWQYHDDRWREKCQPRVQRRSQRHRRINC